MSSVELTRRLTNEDVQFVANTDLIPKAYRNNPRAIFACVLMGRELGFGDMESLRLINVIDGKATLSAEAMVKLVRDRGHSITGKFAPKAVTVHGRRADNGDEMEATWTLEMAKEAGLLEKQNWKRYPQAMLWARAASQLCRMLFADCFGGLSHTPEEMEGTAPDPVDEALDDRRVPLDGGPDDTPELPEATGPGDSGDVEGEAEELEDAAAAVGNEAESGSAPVSEGEPERAAAAEGEQGSFFAQMADEAQRRKAADE